MSRGGSLENRNQDRNGRKNRKNSPTRAHSRGGGGPVLSARDQGCWRRSHRRSGRHQQDDPVPALCLKGRAGRRVPAVLGRKGELVLGEAGSTASPSSA